MPKLDPCRSGENGGLGRKGINSSVYGTHPTRVSSLHLEYVPVACPPGSILRGYSGSPILVWWVWWSPRGSPPRCLFQAPRGSGNCQNKFVPLSRRASNYLSTSKQSANYRGSNRGIVQLWDLRHSAIRASLVGANTAT